MMVSMRQRFQLRNPSVSPAIQLTAAYPFASIKLQLPASAFGPGQDLFGWIWKTDDEMYLLLLTCLSPCSIFLFPISFPSLPSVLFRISSLRLPSPSFCPLVYLTFSLPCFTLFSCLLYVLLPRHVLSP